MRCDYEQTRKAWLLTKTMYSASQDAKVDMKMADKEKTHRTIGNQHSSCWFWSEKYSQKIV